MKKSLGLSLAMVAIALPMVASADAVLIRPGNGELGQGWRFKSADRCLVATAAHVVETGEGVVTTVAGEFAQIVEVERHPTLDLALLTIVGAAAARCPVESMGFADSRPAIEQAARENRSITMQMMPDCGGQPGACAFTNVTIKIDSFSPASSLFFFYPAGGLILDTIGGESGSIVRDTSREGSAAGEPLGILSRAGVERRVPSEAIIFSEVRAMAAARRGQPVKGAGGTAPFVPRGGNAFSFADFDGALPDAACGPANAITARGNCPFRAVPKAGSSSFSVVMVPIGQKPVRAIRFAFDPAAPLPRGVEIAADTAQGWVPLRYCVPNTVDFTCRLAEFQAPRIKLTVTGAASIRSIFWE